jgi:hypothetical protein
VEFPGGARRTRVEPRRFDELAASIAKSETSRRAAVLCIGGGGLAALLATIGIGGVGFEEADAKKPCKKRCKRKDDKDKRRKCKRRCRKKGVGPECRGTGDCQGTDICVDNECVDRPAVPIACSDADPCDGGLVCVGNVCVLECDGDEDCDGALICLGGGCVLDNECDEDDDCDDPLLEICLLGLCVEDIL